MTNPSASGRLATIAARQRGSRLRDVVFAGLVLIAGVVSLSSLATAAHAATPAAPAHILATR